MSLSYDVFTEAFLDKAKDYSFLGLKDFERNGIIDRYMKRAISSFKVCKYKLLEACDDMVREFDVEVKADEVDELADIISEGMLVQWLKPYVYTQEHLESVLNTRDFTTYSPAGMLRQASEVCQRTQKNFTQMQREYSYTHGDLTELHL